MITYVPSSLELSTSLGISIVVVASALVSHLLSLKAIWLWLTDVIVKNEVLEVYVFPPTDTETVPVTSQLPPYAHVISIAESPIVYK